MRAPVIDLGHERPFERGREPCPAPLVDRPGLLDPLAARHPARKLQFLFDYGDLGLLQRCDVGEAGYAKLAERLLQLWSDAGNHFEVVRPGRGDNDGRYSALIA